MNIVVLRGQLSSDPVTRTLPSGMVVWSLEVTTPSADGQISVPVAWFDQAATPQWERGTELVVVGCVKRRFYRTAGGTQSRTEVVATHVIEARKKQAAARLIQRCVAEATESP